MLAPTVPRSTPSAGPGVQGLGALGQGFLCHVLYALCRPLSTTSSLCPALYPPYPHTETRPGVLYPPYPLVHPPTSTPPGQFKACVARHVRVARVSFAQGACRVRASW
jgi:hypothetical protein